MSPHMTAALILAVASLAIYVCVWRARAEFDRHIGEALDVANGPDYEANIAARWIG